MAQKKKLTSYVLKNVPWDTRKISVDLRHVTFSPTDMSCSACCDLHIGKHEVPVKTILSETFDTEFFTNVIAHGTDKDVFDAEFRFGTFYKEEYTDRYLSIPKKDIDTMLVNNAYVDKGLEGHMIGVVLWAAYLKTLRRKTDLLKGTFYQDDSKGRKIHNYLLDYAATSFTTNFVSIFSGINHVKSIFLPKQVHQFEEMDYLSKRAFTDIFESTKNILYSWQRRIDREPIVDLIYKTHEMLEDCHLLDPPTTFMPEARPHIHMSIPRMGKSRF